MARITFASENVQITFSRTSIGLEMSKHCTLLWREAHFNVNVLNAWHVRTLYVPMLLRLAGARGCAPRQKSAKRWGVAGGWPGVFEEGPSPEKCFSRGGRDTGETIVRCVKRSGR